MPHKREIIPKEFVDSTNRAAKSVQLGTALWPVYQDFGVEEKNGEVYVYAPYRPEKLEARPGTILEIPPKDLNLRRYYAPLREEPDLVFKFASLARKGPLTKDQALEAMLDWVKNYGTLGGNTYYFDAPGNLPRESHRRECLSDFEPAVNEAARCVGMYAAARAPVTKATDAALQRYGVSGSTREQRREMALRTVGEIVGAHVRNECYPVLYPEHDNQDVEKTAGFSLGWDFHSLRGAMYLELAWLMDRGITVRYCKGPGCPFLIRYDRSRKDKEFCSPNCKEKWRYHHRVKPRKQAASQQHSNP